MALPIQNIGWLAEPVQQVPFAQKFAFVASRPFAFPLRLCGEAAEAKIADRLYGCLENAKVMATREEERR